MSECKHRKPNGVCVIETEVVYRGYCVDGPCSCFEPKTNADRIRAMTDEELATAIDTNFNRAPWCSLDCNCMKCTECIVKWLRSEK